MNFTKAFTRAALTAALFVPSSHLFAADVLNASYYALAFSDADVNFNQGNGQLDTTVGHGLGPDGLPVALATSTLHDLDSNRQITWWSPSLNSNVSVLNNPVYPSQITLPFNDDNMYTNTTVLGQNGDDSQAFLTAKFIGNFTLATDSAVTFNVCSDDDEFVYLSGGVFGGGTAVVENGGIHGKSCTAPNLNTALLNDVAAGNYTLSVFYADRERTGAAFELDATSLGLTAPTSTPEPATFALLGSAGTLLLAFRRRNRA